MAMRDSHRLFLQAFMSHGILSSHDVKKKYNLACARYEGEVDPGKLGEFVQLINVNLKSLHLQIKKAISEDTGKQFYSLVNLQDSDITKLSSDYSLSELEFFKKIVEHVVESDSGTMSSIDALNVEQEVGKMTKKDLEELLAKFERDQWLDISRKGDISLATRSLLELDSYIEQQFPDHAVKCEICKRLCVKGQLCSNCDVKIHLICAAKYFQDGKECKCPSARCATPWPHSVPQIAASESSSQASQANPTPSQSSQLQVATRATRRSTRH